MGKAELPLHAPGTKLDRGYIGQSVPFHLTTAEFLDEVKMHREALERHFGCRPRSFRNTELIYSNEIAGVLGVYLSIPVMAALRIVWRRGRIYVEKKRFGPLNEYTFGSEIQPRR